MSEEQENWSVIDDSNPKKKLKYYLNVCRPVNPVHVGTGCDSFAAACQTSIENGEVSVTCENLLTDLSDHQFIRPYSRFAVSAATSVCTLD